MQTLGRTDILVHEDKWLDVWRTIAKGHNVANDVRAIDTTALLKAIPQEHFILKGILADASAASEQGDIKIDAAKDKKELGGDKGDNNIVKPMQMLPMLKARANMSTEGAPLIMLEHFRKSLELWLFTKQQCCAQTRPAWPPTAICNDFGLAKLFIDVANTSPNLQWKGHKVFGW